MGKIKENLLKIILLSIAGTVISFSLVFGIWKHVSEPENENPPSEEESEEESAKESEPETEKESQKEPEESNPDSPSQNPDKEEIPYVPAEGNYTLEEAKKIKKNEIIYLTSASPVTSKEVYVPCTVSVANSAYDVTNLSAQIRIRGNSSANNTSTPPFKIKLDEKANLLGLHGGEKFKTWVLLKTSYVFGADRALLKMGRAIYDDRYFVSDAALCNVFLNGRYMGTYVLAEQTQIKKNRVNVKESVDLAAPGDTFGYLFEMENHPEQEEYVFTIHSQDRPTIDFKGNQKYLLDRKYSVKNDSLSPAQLAFLSDYMNRLFTLFYEATYHGKAYRFNSSYELEEASNLTPEEAVREVMDIDSAVAIYILEELANNLDNGAGSFFMCIDFSKGAKYPKLTFMPPWDLGWCNESVVNDYYAGTLIQNKISPIESDNMWLVMLAYQKWFRDEVTRKVNELSANGKLMNSLTETENKLSLFSSDESASRIQSGRQRIMFYKNRFQWLLNGFNR